ncbi:TetR/AcrR family transcriptional regulator [Priestia megaterium]
MEPTNSKEKILSAAAKLFRKKGYHATSLSQITKESSAPRGSIYYYFPDGKQQLAKEAIQKTGERVKAYIEKSLASHEDAASAIQYHIKLMADRMFEQVENEADISLAAMSSEVWSSNETLRMACEAVYNEWEQVYANKLVCSGYEQEEARQLGSAIQSWIEGAYTLSLTKNSTVPMQITADQIGKLFANKN